MKIKCNLCNSEFNIGNGLNNHLENYHFISYNQYVERGSNENEVYMNPWTGYKLPKNYSLNEFMEVLDLYFSYLLDDNNFSRLWILNKKYRDMMIVYNFSYYDAIFTNLIKSKCLVYDDINLFDININESYPKILSKENISGISLTQSRTNIMNNELYESAPRSYLFRIKNSEYRIDLPEIIPYDNKNHYRYNILSTYSNPQSCKKLWIPNDKYCIKFYNTSFDECKSILRIYRNGNRVHSVSLSDSEIYYIKFYIMSNKEILREVLSVIRELIRNSDVTSDNSLILNSIQVNQYGKFNLNIGWTCIDNILRDKGTLNVSII